MEFSLKRKSHAFQLGKELEVIFQRQISEGKEKFSSASSSGVTFSVSKLKFLRNLNKFQNNSHTNSEEGKKVKSKTMPNDQGEMGNSSSASKEKKPIEPGALNINPRTRNQPSKNPSGTKHSSNSGITIDAVRLRNQTRIQESEPSSSISNSRSLTRVAFVGQTQSQSASSSSLSGPSSSLPSSSHRRTERIKSIKRPNRYPFPLQPTSSFYVAELPSSSSTQYDRPIAKPRTRDRHNSLTITVSSPGESPSRERSETTPRNPRRLERIMSRRSASVDDLLGILGDEEEQDANYQSERRESNFSDVEPEPTNSNTLMQFSDDEQEPEQDVVVVAHNSTEHTPNSLQTTLLDSSGDNFSESWRTFYETIAPEFDPIFNGNTNPSSDSLLEDEFSMLSTRTESLNSISMLDKPIVNLDTSPGDLKLHDKVVWFTETGIPETGTVKWIGNEFDKSGRWFAGVEFKNAVGNCSGKWNGKQYFTSRLTHGRFLPISELILYLDFYGSAISNAPANINYPNWNDKATKGIQPSNPIICVICQDPLLETEKEAELADTETENQGESNKDRKSDQEMVTTFCGHLFHANCLAKWFNTKKKIEQPCPYCQKMMHISRIIRIFPVQSKN